MYHLRVPQTEEELERYYQFRWEMLRKPLHQPKGSERDAWDAMAHHQMVVDEQGNLVAVGRLYINADNEASIRFMAVHPDVQDKGLGTLMAMTLESVARQEGVKRVTCSAREDAVEFFAKLGFVNQGEITTPTTTPIRHFLMIKPVATLDDILHRGDWCAQLQQAWYEHIPLSEKMGVRIQQYTGQKFITTMPETGNQNPHHTLFAGSKEHQATIKLHGKTTGGANRIIDKFSTGRQLRLFTVARCHYSSTFVEIAFHLFEPGFMQHQAFTFCCRSGECA